MKNDKRFRKLFVRNLSFLEEKLSNCQNLSETCKIIQTNEFVDYMLKVQAP